LPFATNHNARMFYRLQGNAGRPVLILSHSIGTDHSMWELQVEDLLPHFQVLRYDTRGHGASDATSGEYSIEMLGKDILALADMLGISQFAFCGLSLAGARHTSCAGGHVAAVRAAHELGSKNCSGRQRRNAGDRRCGDAAVLLT
jgi:3-oxoadipate enol-lactonase